MRTTLTILVFASLISAAGCADSTADEQPAPSDAAIETTTEQPAHHVVDVVLTEYAFEASQDTFEVGAPYIFRLVNEGSVAHEWALVPRGDANEDALLIEVEEDELPVGGSYEVEFTFSEAGEFDFACFMEEPVSHDAAGMRIPVVAVGR